MWNKELKDLIIHNNGSVQGIDIIPQNIKDVYKTVWEISMKSVINQAASRGAFICQTQSMNLFVQSPTIKKLSSMHMYAYSKHLKTGMYYLRSKSSANSAKFSIDPTSVKKQKPSDEEILMCSRENPESCDLCTSWIHTKKYNIKITKFNQLHIKINNGNKIYILSFNLIKKINRNIKIKKLSKYKNK